MNNKIATQQNQTRIQQFFSQDMVQGELQKILGQNASSFSASVVQIVNNNTDLQSVDPKSIFGSALTAATLNLPINNNLGFAYIVPFKGKAQFQIGYKGFIQLAQRTGQFKRINASAIYEGDSEQDVYQRLTSFIPKSHNGKIIAYIAYFELLNGFQAHFSMNTEDMGKHAKNYSQTYKNGKGIWKDNFKAMALKTVIKMLLSKQAPLSIDSQIATAVQADQAVIIDGQYRYLDNEPSFDNHAQPVQIVQAAKPQMPCYNIEPVMQAIANMQTLDDCKAIADGIAGLKAQHENGEINLCGDDLQTLRNVYKSKNTEIKDRLEQAAQAEKPQLDTATQLVSEITKLINATTLVDADLTRKALYDSKAEIGEVTFAMLDEVLDKKLNDLNDEAEAESGFCSSVSSVSSV